MLHKPFSRIKLIWLFVILSLAASSAFCGNHNCDFDRVLVQSLDQVRPTPDKAKALKVAFEKQNDPFEDIELMRKWLSYVNQNNIVTEKTAALLRSMDGIKTQKTRARIYYKLMDPPHNLGHIEATKLTDLIVESYVRMEVPKRGVWTPGRIKEHIIGVTIGYGEPLMNGGGHTKRGLQKFLDQTYNPVHPREQIKIVERELGKMPTLQDFQSGDVILYRLPNGVGRAYIPADMMTRVAFNKVRSSARHGYGFYQEPIEKGTEAYVGKTLFPSDWTEEDILAAQREVITHPKGVVVKIEEGKASRIMYRGTYNHKGHVIKLTVIGGEREGAIILGTIYPDWVQ